MDNKGLHIITDLKNISKNLDYLKDPDKIESICEAMVVLSKLQPVGSIFKSIESGVTGMTLLAESHIAIHTNYETKEANIDVYVCNVSCNNRDKAKMLSNLIINFFDAKFVVKKEVDRE